MIGQSQFLICNSLKENILLFSEEDPAEFHRILVLVGLESLADYHKENRTMKISGQAVSLDPQMNENYFRFN